MARTPRIAPLDKSWGKAQNQTSVANTRRIRPAANRSALRVCNDNKMERGEMSKAGSCRLSLRRSLCRALAQRDSSDSILERAELFSRENFLEVWRGVRMCWHSLVGRPR